LTAEAEKAISVAAIILSTLRSRRAFHRDPGRRT
jgi:hypothetical protein